MMQAIGQKNLPKLKPTLEIDPDHEIIKKLLTTADTRKEPFWQQSYTDLLR
jgi:molecular chaperone HtpG